jgi:DNA-binding GntR family transcriptional regulator
MTPPRTFERVYDTIKQRLREGIYRPGQRLEPAVLSIELNASVTPVRDALHRLTGERMVEAPRQEGFRVPMLNESVLRQLYAWHLDLLLLALMRRPPADLAAFGRIERGPDLPATDLRAALFRAVAISAGNAEHVAALDGLNERLGPVQRLEEQILEGTRAETADILQAIDANDRQALRRSLIRYHRRRERIIPELLAQLLQI